MSASKVVLKILHICIIALLIVLVAFGLLQVGTAAYDMGYRVFTEGSVDSEPGRDVVVEVTEGMSALSLGRLLEEKGLVDSAYVFMAQMKLSVYANKVKPGLYTLNTSQTAEEMLAVMSASDEPAEEETEE